MPEEIQAETVAPVAEAAPVAAPDSLAGQYELGDVAYDDVADAVPESPPKASSSQTFTETPATTSSPGSPPKHSARLLRMATELGLSEAEISSTPTEQLDDLVYHLNRQQLAMLRDYSRTEAQRGSERAPEPTPTPAVEDDDLGIDESQYDEGLVRAIKASGKKQAKELAELKAQLANLTQREQAREAETTDQIIDRVFADINDPRLGKGPMRGLSADSDARGLRQAIVDASLKRQGSLEEKIRAAYKLFYGDRAKAAAAEPAADLGKRREAWNGAAVARPTQREGAPEPKGDKRAMAAAARVIRDQGGIDDDELLDGFLP